MVMSHCHVSFRWGYVLNSETSPSVNIVVTLIRQQRSSSLLFPLAVPLFEQRPETIPQVKGAVFASVWHLWRDPLKKNLILADLGGLGWFSLPPKRPGWFPQKVRENTVVQIHSRSLPWETSSRAAGPQKFSSFQPLQSAREKRHPPTGPQP